MDERIDDGQIDLGIAVLELRSPFFRDFESVGVTRAQSRQPVTNTVSGFIIGCGEVSGVKPLMQFLNFRSRLYGVECAKRDNMRELFGRIIS